MSPVETIQYRGHTIEIHQDEDAQNPREYGGEFGTMACWHRRYNLGDKKEYEDQEAYLRHMAGDCGTPVDTDSCSMETVQKIIDKHYLVLPLYLYDHSGITMSCSPFSCPWDSGQVGFIYVSHKDIRKNWSVKSVRHTVKNHKGKRIKAIDYARQMLIDEVKTYDCYLTNDVYGYTVDSIDESRWGFFGSALGCNEKEGDRPSSWNDMVQEAKDSIDSHIACEAKKHAGQVKAWIVNKVSVQHRVPFMEGAHA